MNTKFKYYLKSKDGSITKKVYTLEEIEQHRIWEYWTNRDFEVIARCAFTGLTDKNGVEIFHKDIIDEGEETLANLNRKYIVEWVDNGWSLFIPPFHSRHFRDAQGMTVIGNTIESPTFIGGVEKE